MTHLNCHKLENHLHITHLATYVPNRRITVSELRDFGILDNQKLYMFNKIYGINAIPRSNMSLHDLLSISLYSLFQQQGIEFADISAMIYCYDPKIAMPEVLGVMDDLARAHGLGHLKYVPLSEHRCAAGIISFEVANQLLADQHSDSCILLLTGEIVATHNTVFHNIALLGEASTACIISKKNIGRRICSVVFSSFNASCDSPDQMIETYLKNLKDMIKAAICKAGLNDIDIAFMLPHNTNFLTWRLLSERYPFDLSRIYTDNISRIGHCLASDPLLNLDNIEREGKVRKGDYVVVTAVGGLGSTLAASVIQV